ncbi:hypothetical protein AB0B04_18635 [Streptomyces xinghaiensis]|uniref:Uncharacterized protein n=2 Tax=Streptomyces TaxID=1883 RepID=A0A3M8EYG0_9ACTN|nr:MULTISPECIES: hypothetical protein [Streptomyces]KNE81418.1 hypothetical protein ADZ36_16750 [Streptomyces fradiae]OFA48236.1 hypothetical protein BEN35_19015 [Streptomyces fradiae]PQM20697.1 hypothetical protein Sfr7A_26305 [Streptomyces xinghaiensis]RKM92638.1 hypothetical protein SFRA_024960 [Streptomyces xinghaiensis]RNC70606.1 hypothetical protein DC095_025950 [Streptomyces xinghaiensis]
MLAKSLPAPGKPLSVAQALAVGSALVAADARPGHSPQWFRDGWDVLDLLAAGMAGGHVQAREEQFTAMRDAWLDQIRTDPFWTAVTDMLDLLVRISHDLGEPVDDPTVLMSLIADLVDVPSCMQPIPARLRPDAAADQPGPGQSGIGTAVLREALALRPGTRVLTSDGEVVSIGPQAVEVLREMADARAQILGRPLQPGEPVVGGDDLDGFEAWAQSLMEQFDLAPALRHAARVTGFMPPGRSGLPNQHHQDEWDQSVEDYLRDHPAEAADFDPEEEADKVASLQLLVSMQSAANSPRVRAATLRQLRDEPDGDLAMAVIRMMPAALQVMGRTALLDIVQPYVQGVDGAPSMIQIGKALLWLEKQLKAGNRTYTSAEAAQAAAMAPEFYCVLAAAQTPTP